MVLLHPPHLKKIKMPDASIDLEIDDVERKRLN